MKRNKIGVMFLVSVLALAGIGISYAGFSDAISIYGTVDTATVSLVVEDYSGTDVWKVWGPEYAGDEVFIFRGFIDDRMTEAQVKSQTGAPNAELVSSAWAFEGTDPYDVKMDFDNLFPCIDFTADFIFHYTGTIPVKVTDLTFEYDAGYDFTLHDWFSWRAYRVYEVNETWEIHWDEPVDVGYQLHNCNYVYVEVTIHLPQDNDLQGLEGSFTADIGVIQWYDPVT